MIEQIEWVACAERLPESGETVLICMTGEAESAWFGRYYPRLGRYKAGWRDADGYSVDVTHWAPLPKGPRA